MINTGGGGLSNSSSASSAAHAASEAANNVQLYVDSGGGVNLGEILKPFVEGSSQNGGSGIVIPSRLVNGTDYSSLSSYNSQTKTSSGNLPLIIGGGVVLLLLTILMVKMV